MLLDTGKIFLHNVASKVYEVNATIITFVFVSYCIMLKGALQISLVD